MKSFENVSCNVIECESLEEQLRRIDDLCAKVGAGWTVDVNYSVAKGMLVCGIYSEWPECNCLHDGKTLDEVEVILREIREKKREHQKKIFVEAAEIAADTKEGFDVTSLVDKDFDYVLAVRQNDKIIRYYYSSKIKRWIYKAKSEYVDALTGQIYSDSEIFN